MEIIGIRGLALNLFKSYLHDRMQKVIVDEVVISDASEVKCRVPQGAFLDTTLSSFLMLPK